MLADLAFEAFAAVCGRPLRSFLTGLGIAIGVTTLTAMIGMSTSGADSIASEFDALKATRVEVSGPETIGEFIGAVGTDGLTRVQNLNGVTAVGWSALSADQVVHVSGFNGGPRRDLPLMATDGDILGAEQAQVVAGRMFDVASRERGDKIVVLGSRAAELVGVTTDRIPSTVSIDGLDFVVAGIVDTADTASMLPSAVLVPQQTARRTALARKLGAPVIVVRVKPGAGEQVGREAPIALSPTVPDTMSAAVPPRPVSLENAVRAQTQQQLIALAAVSIVVGAIGVSNTTLAGVLERTPEIGVRRAIGANRRSVVLQFLYESSTLGLLGGAAGSLLGLIVTFTMTAINGWALVLPSWLVPLGPVLGLGVGLLAGTYPAFRASRIEPIEALRS